jgi:hypothetical protein
MLTTKVKGEYKILVYKPDGSLKQETEWFDNLVLNNGLDLLAGGNGSSIFAQCVVGSGTTTPAVTQTTLTNLVLSTSTKQSGSNTWYSSPYYYETIITYRFAAVGAGLSYNLNEVGVGKTTTSLFSRALITDGSGTQITVSITEGEILDVIYKFRNYPPLTDADYSQSVTISGTSYTFTWRPSYVGTATGWNIWNNSPIVYTYYLTAHSGSVGAITSVPSGTATEVSNTSPAQYVVGTYTNSATMTFGLSQANYGGGITAFKFNRGGNGTTQQWGYQCSVSPAIAKTSAQSLKIVGQMSWERY